MEFCSNKIRRANVFNSPFELSKIIYLGPKFRDNNLAYMMFKKAIIDPFIETERLIILPAIKEACVFRCDLDTRILNGYSVERIYKRSPFYSENKKLDILTLK